MRALLMQRAYDSKNVVYFESGYVGAVTLYEQSVAHAQGDQTHFAPKVFAVAVQAKHLKAETFAKAESLERAPDQRILLAGGHPAPA